MPKLFDNAKRIGRKIGLNDEKGYGIAVFLALIVVAVIVTGYFVSAALNPPKGYSTIYLLDSSEKAVEYPEVVVVGQSSTVWLAVENHYPVAVSFVVEVKITDKLSMYPQDANESQTYVTGAIAPQDSWRNMVTLTENNPGDYAVVFELYKLNGDAAEFTYNYCVLNLEVKE
ncbi:MAG TPA: DUF1616 domain-containing protein [Candidatus Deferrimicrobiaceae bacterium]|nr:DUF1616 domain-containing protein [Candidatus Deferrimicrobiaceae bacterium]